MAKVNLEKAVQRLFDNYWIRVSPGDGNYNHCLKYRIIDDRIFVYPEKGNRIETILPLAGGSKIKFVGAEFYNDHKGLRLKTKNSSYLILTEYDPAVDKK
ncbi:MAG: hypothetical protein PHF86_13635 [Candidatus Nanoarchaeia archaeon]|nr:hypothetical protein [Candidatus Nanoarchaeia archaeon]